MGRGVGYYYYDGFAFFETMLGSALLSNGFGDDAEIAALLPQPLSELFPEFARSHRGRRQLDGIDAAAQAPYFTAPPPMSEASCALIAKRASR